MGQTLLYLCYSDLPLLSACYSDIPTPINSKRPSNNWVALVPIVAYSTVSYLRQRRFTVYYKCAQNPCTSAGAVSTPCRVSVAHGDSMAALISSMMARLMTAATAGALLAHVFVDGTLAA